MPLSSSQLNVPSELKFTASAENSVEWMEAAAQDSGGSKLRKFSMLAYSGGPMDVGFGYPVVVDLAGISVTDKSRPILRDHDPGKVVGHTTGVDVKAKSIRVSGVISGTNEHANDVLTAADNGFPWQASIGARIKKMEFADKGDTIEANGRKFTGPVYVARESVLGEVSFVALGADDNTSATVIAATRCPASHYLGSSNMSVKFKEWLAAKGIPDADKLEAPVLKVLEASYEEEATKPADQEAKIVASESLLSKESVDKYIEASASKKAAEHFERLGQIQELTVDFPKLAASAIRESWSLDKLRAEVNGAKLEALRASRADNPGGIGGRESCNGLVLEAALCMSRGIKTVEKDYTDKTLQAAHTQFRRGIGVQQLLLAAAAQNGMPVNAGDRVHSGNIRDVLAFACTGGSRNDIQASGAFSTVSVPGILSNVANKDILQGYLEEEQTWREISQVKSVTDFKVNTSYRMLDNMEYEEVGAGGQIKHGSISEESYTRQVDTYAKMFALTRKDIINDDLAAFDDLRNRIGRGGAKKLNRLFWTTWLNNASFFTSGRGNYITGSTTTLLTDMVGLQLALDAFDALRTPAADGSKVPGGLVGGSPEILLTPGGAIASRAEQIYKNSNLGSGTANADANIFSGRYRPVKSVFLNDATISGYSATAWYLLRSPSSAPGIVVSFLNGQEAPTVESAEADFNTLGIQMRGYHDFGCDLAEYLCGVKSKGAA